QRDDRLRSKTKENQDNYGIPKNLGTARPFTDNLYQVNNNINGKSLSGAYDKSLKKLILPVEFHYVEYWNKALFLSANKDGDTYAYDLKGNKLLKEPMSYFSQGGNEKTPVVLATNKNKKYAVFSKNFKPITEFIYDYISPSNYFLNGIINQNGKQERKTVLMNLDGKPVKFNVEYDELRYKTNEFDDVVEAFLFLRKKDKLAIVNNQGKLISDFVYDEIIPECYVASEKLSLYEELMMQANHPNRFIYFKKDNKYGVMDNNYKVILDNTYDMITESTQDNYIYIAKNISGRNKWGIYNVAERKEILTPQFDTWIKSSDGFFIARKDGKYGIYNGEGKEILPPAYDREIRVNKLYNGLYTLSLEYGLPFAYMDSLGNLIKVEPKKLSLN
ncbi:WG repeat-containing protein, partial [Chryseobacterium sp. Alg-005]|uniref:WG repeat-containing protein n=1 Tax=Chryseobacterium sp. Alg-005 TaxID=3159516 RepID=UPI0036F344AF